MITPLLQSSVSHDPSEIIIICWFAAQETFLIIIIVIFIIINIKNFLIKRKNLFEIKSFCNIIHYTIQKLWVSFYRAFVVGS